MVEIGLSDFGVKYREGGDIPYDTSTTTSRALFRSRTTVNLLLILLFLLFLPVTEDRGRHGDIGTEAAMCLETWLGCGHIIYNFTSTQGKTLQPDLPLVWCTVSVKINVSKWL